MKSQLQKRNVSPSNYKMEIKDYEMSSQSKITAATWFMIIPVSTALTGGASDFPQPSRPQGRKLSLDRDVYYFENNRREEVVAYDNQSAKTKVCGKSFSQKIKCPNPK